MQDDLETGALMDSNEIVERKVRALGIRQRIEYLATNQWADFSGHAYDTLSHSQISLRLHLLISRVGPTEQHKAHGMVVALANAYGATSNIIHGRSLAARVRSVQFDEWEALLTEVERIAARTDQGAGNAQGV